jgi:preprotein translocase subunit SecF
MMEGEKISFKCRKRINYSVGKQGGVSVDVTYEATDLESDEVVRNARELLRRAKQAVGLSDD